MRFRFAVVDGQRREAQPGLSGNCPGCGSAMLAKCGDLRVWHWAHRGRRTCDHWWESESEWHRTWKDQFPVHWQEVVHRAEDGEKHIADVKTEYGRVIEFQHSYLRSEERRAREFFYRRMVWVVDGLRRKSDGSRFLKALRFHRVLSRKPLTLCVSSESCPLLRDWAGSRVPVFFDFGGTIGLHGMGAPVLWRLDPKSQKGWANVAPVLRASFIDGFRRGVDYKGVAAPLVRRRASLPRLRRGPGLRL